MQLGDGWEVLVVHEDPEELETEALEERQDVEDGRGDLGSYRHYYHYSFWLLKFTHRFMATKYCGLSILQAQL